MKKVSKFGLVAVLALAVSAVVASAAMATTVTPAGEAFRATIASGNFKFETGIGQTTCTSIVAEGTVPTPNSNPGGPISAALHGEVEEAPEITGCSAQVFGIGVGSAEATTTEEWEVEVEDPNTVNPEGPSSVARIIVPPGGLIMDAHVFGSTCVAEGREEEEGEVQFLEGEWVNGSPSTIHIVNQHLPVNVHGAFFCNEPEGTATVNGTLAISAAGGGSITVETP